ncbi:DUF1573 domain-containing protein [Lignipirellula cremea]|uniref:DUF1573 domain-containing protein n=1 Tax=Lignipirellula cremea TaxID=2528010 RepID=A0A518E1Z8_9BACT|nr:DUF1573 domain-containing protein [Lignipirellula cremea]QDU98115.1 hypothetical protein Pla8534_59760 [Lignipirellula cremea]
MKKMLLIVLGLFVVLCTPVVFGVVIQGSKPYVQKFHHPKMDYQLAQKAKAEARAARLAALEPQVPDTGTPKAEFTEVNHDFGLMAPQSTSRHTFQVRNTGDGYLRLTPGGTSCKCTDLIVDKTPIAPGGVGEVIMEWNSDISRPSFRQYSYVKTNDPDQPEVKLEIHGRVRVVLGQDPPEQWFSRLIRGETATDSFVIYSQELESFQLGDFVSSWSGLTWEVKPAPVEKLQTLNAKCGYEVTLTTPSTFEENQFTHWLRYEAIPDDASQSPRPGQIMVHGRVLRCLSVYGHNLLEGGVIDLGVVDEGESATSHLYIRSRSFDGELKILKVEVEPEFLDVQVRPFSGEGAERTFHLDVTIPDTAPTCRYDQGEWGSVRIHTNHPIAPDVKLKVQMHVRKPIVFE